MFLLSLLQNVNDVLFDDGCCEAGSFFDCCGNDGRVALDSPDVLRSNVGHVQLHCFDAELRRPFQDDSVAGDFVNRGALCDAHDVFLLLRRNELINVETVIGGHAAHDVNVVRHDMDDTDI